MEKDLFAAGILPVAEMRPTENGGCGCSQEKDNARCGFDGCGADSFGLAEHPLAMVYAPCQAFRALYDPDTALGRGTLFCELDLPVGCCSGVSCRVESRR